MSPETRERLRECLDETDGRMAVDRLLQIVEEAAEEARASERERVFKAIRASLIDDATTPQQMFWNEGVYHAAALASWTGAAPPSPEPERAPLFPNERFEAQSGNLPPLTYDWAPKPREPEPQTEAQRELLRKLRGDDVHALLPAVETRMREIATEELNARPFMEYRRTLKPLDGRVGHLEEQSVKATLRAQALAERVEALEGDVPDKVSTYVRALVEALEEMKRDEWEKTAEEARQTALESWGRLASLKAKHEEMERRVASLEGMAPATTPCTCPDGMIGHLPGCPVLLRMQERR